MGGCSRSPEEFAALSLAQIEELLESDIPRGARRRGQGAPAAGGGAGGARTGTHRGVRALPSAGTTDRLLGSGRSRRPRTSSGRTSFDKPRDLLDRLAASGSPWERRTALYATIAFVRTGQTDDAFRIAERLIEDTHDSVQKAVRATVLRGARRTATPERLRAVLDRHVSSDHSPERTPAETRPEKLDQRSRDHLPGDGGRAESAPASGPLRRRR
jgi:hypothetical protein